MYVRGKYGIAVMSQSILESLCDIISIKVTIKRLTSYILKVSTEFISRLPSSVSFLMVKG